MLEQFEKYITTGNQDGMLNLGAQVQFWKNETEAKLEKQLRWLEKNLPARAIAHLDTPDDRAVVDTYESRYTQWSNLLREYEKACQLLERAQQCL